MQLGPQLLRPLGQTGRGEPQGVAQQPQHRVGAGPVEVLEQGMNVRRGELRLEPAYVQKQRPQGALTPGTSQMMDVATPGIGVWQRIPVAPAVDQLLVNGRRNRAGVCS
jgi:hypothetical protein